MSKEYLGWRFDVLKLVLAVMVVMIHTYPLPSSLSPILSVAVPMFFMMSSFFFWQKCDNEGQMSWSFVGTFVKRLFYLYLFWSVVLLVPTWFIQYRYLCYSDIFTFCCALARDIFVKGFFEASWFLVALATAMPIVFFLVKKKVGGCGLFSLALLAFVFCYIEGQTTSRLSWEDSVFNIIHVVIPCVRTSFVSAIPWIVIGRVLSENKTVEYSNKKQLWFVLPLSLFFMLLLLWEASLKISSWYVTTVFLSVSLFLSVLCIPEFAPKDLRWCRRISIVIYCSHKTIDILINTGARFLWKTELKTWPLFFLTLLISSLIAILILVLSKKEQFRILRYAY